MTLTPIKLSTNPGHILDFTGHSPASVFNDAILPRVNSFLDLLPEDPAGLEASREQRQERLSQDLDLERAFQQEDEDFYAQLRQRQTTPVEQPADMDYDTPIPRDTPQQPQPQAQAQAGGGYKSPTPDLVNFVKEFEGYNPNAFGDYKQTSIGYGTRAKPGEKSITREEAEARLAAELGKARAHVEQINQKHGYNFAPHELDALTSFAYNVGNVNQLTANGARQRDEIARKMLEYNKAGGRPLKGLTRRRQAESALFTKGY